MPRDQALIDIEAEVLIAADHVAQQLDLIDRLADAGEDTQTAEKKLKLLTAIFLGAMDRRDRFLAPDSKHVPRSLTIPAFGNLN